MENVPEMLSKKYWNHFEEARSIFSEAGYHVSQAIYNAASFGVPQERFRALVVAMKKPFLLPKPRLLAPMQYKTVRSAIGKLPPVKPGKPHPEDPLHRSAGHRESTLETIRAVPKDGGSRPAGVGPECLDRVKGFYDVYGRLSWDKPAITITHYARNPASGRYVHPEQDRGLTAREAALLQSFPKEFQFCGSFDSVFKQIGEAVPPKFAAVVAANSIVELISTSPTTEELNHSVAPVTEPVSSSFSSVIAGLKMARRQPNVFSCVDAFSGAGGLSLGLSQAGFKVVLSFDNDPICVETQRHNSKYFKHDIALSSIEEMLDGELLKRIGLQRGELDLLAGGPPCQGFSVQRIGSDKDDRNDLVIKYFQLVEEVRPKFFLMENVKGLAGKRGRQYLSDVMKKATNIGYHMHLKVLDAQDYGVPQRRQRVILVGELLENGQLPIFAFPEPTTSNGNGVTVKMAIGAFPAPPQDGSDHPDFPHHRRDRLSDINKRRLAALKPGQGREHLPAELLADCHKLSSDKIGHRNVYGRMAWNEVAPTITARFDSFTRGKFGHPTQIRSITLREGAELQTFPSDMTFIGNKVDIARQIGNAVPRLLAAAIGRNILECLRQKIG